MWCSTIKSYNDGYFSTILINQLIVQIQNFIMSMTMFYILLKGMNKINLILGSMNYICQSSDNVKKAIKQNTNTK